MDARFWIKTSQSPVDGPEVDAAFGGNAFGGMTGGDLDPHTINDHSFCEFRKDESHRVGEIANSVRNAQYSGMPRPKKSRENDPWKQRDFFIGLVDAKKVELMGAGLTEEEALIQIAKALGLKTTASLTTAYRHDHARAPKRKTIHLASIYFVVPETKLWGNPVEDNLSPAKWLAMHSVTKFLESPETTDEDARKMIERITSLQEEGKIPRPRQ